MDKKNITVILGVVVVVALVIFFVVKSDAPESESGDSDSGAGDSIPVPEVSETTTEVFDENSHRFYHPELKFSLVFPNDLKNTNFFEGAGEQILFQDSESESWFQMYVTDWDEGNNITPERIRQDLPDLVIKEPQYAILGPKREIGVGPRALIFFGYEDGIGETREVWFVHSRKLYQVTTNKSLDSFLAQILSTIEFN